MEKIESLEQSRDASKNGKMSVGIKENRWVC